MKAIYLTTDGDSTTVLPYPIDLHEYGCGVIEMNGKVIIPRERKNNVETQIPKPIPIENNNDDDDNDLANSQTKKKRDVAANNDNLFLCCDIVEESFVGEKKLPVLRCIRRKNAVVNPDIHHVIWLSVVRPNISSIRLYICDEGGNIISLPRNKLNCTLLFIPHKVKQ